MHTIVNEFNDFFVNMGSDLAKKIPVVDNISVDSFLKMNNSNSLFLTPITEEEILNVVLNMSNKTSTDCYNINMETVKKCIDVIVKPLTNIFNKSFNTGVFPDSMKTAKVVPIFKSGNKSEFTNYRPISLLPQFSKILEKLFDIRFESFLNKNNVLNESQYGFRSGRSTLMALTEMLEEITTAKDKKNVYCGSFY